MQKNTPIREALSFDDVLIAPAETQVKPADVDTRTRLTRTISLNIPVVSAARPQVTESAMAIAIAQLGGIGVIHDNMPVGKQVEEVRRVKRAGGDMVENPIITSPESSVAEAVDLLSTYKISALPVIEQATKKVVGIITSRDVRFFEDMARPVSELMTKRVVTVKAGVDKADARRLMHEHRIEKLIVVDAQDRCVGLMTVKDMEKFSQYPNAARDSGGYLRVGASIGIGKDSFDRAAAMADAGLDVVFVDVAHAHTRDAIGTVSRIRQQRSTEVQIVAGNVVTAEAARSLIDAGADAIKVGIGGTGCSPLRAAGVGMPQLTAIMDVAEQCNMQDIPVIVDGGIRHAADFAKAMAAGADAVMINSLFESTDQAPFQATASAPVSDPYRFDADSIQGSHRGSIVPIANELLAGLKMAMAYTGSKNLKNFHETATFVRTSKS